AQADPQGDQPRARGREHPPPQHHADDGHDDDLARRLHLPGGDVDPGEKEGGSLGRKIPRLTSYLAALHQEELKKVQLQGGDPSKAKEPELLIIADRMTPYNLLVEVMFSAKQKEAGFKHFRLIVQKNFPPHVAKQ
ncbi:MAG TPA: hypothetical protein VGG28_10135, partial [Kofleriaceae bacterium]